MLVRNGVVVTHKGQARANVLLKDGKVEALTGNEPRRMRL